MLRDEARKPDFRNLEIVLEKGIPTRPVLFDFIIGDRIEKMLTGNEYKTETEFQRLVTRMKAFDYAGYDFSPIIIRGLTFQRNHSEHQGVTKSLNEGAIITDRESFDKYQWPEIENCDFSMIKKVGEYLPEGMKFIPFSLDGVLENVIGVTGYENLCIMLYEDRELVSDIFENIGSRLLSYFEKCLEYDEVGAILQNDDWGFNTQTFLSPKDMREFVFPWHKKMAEAAHKKGKYAILHSCGYFNDIIEDVIEDIKMDARHSYEDTIVPVEQAYEDLYPRIAVLGGMDIDFLARSSDEDVYKRSRAILERTQRRGGYALGSGNSVPDYVPDQNFIAMVKAALDFDK